MKPGSSTSPIIRHQALMQISSAIHVVAAHVGGGCRARLQPCTLFSIIFFRKMLIPPAKVGRSTTRRGSGPGICPRPRFSPMQRGWCCAGLLAAILLTGCGTGRPSRAPAEARDAYYHRMLTSGHAAFERGDLARAAELYENAWVRAQVMDRPTALGTAGYNLALVKIALGDRPEAHRLLRAARAELERAGDPTEETWVLEAEVVRHLGQHDQAWAITDEALERFGGQRGFRSGEIQLRTLRALLALEQEDDERAWPEFDRAIALRTRGTAPRLRARLAEVRGRLAWAADDPLTAAESFDAEARYYRTEGRFPDMARALVRAGQAFEAAQEGEAAADRYVRAARHFMARDQHPEALRWLERAVPMIEKANNPELTGRVADLLEVVLGTREANNEND